MFRWILVLLQVFGFFFSGLAQDDTVPGNPTVLDEVEIRSFSLSRFAAGSKQVSFDSAAIERFRGNTLSELLQQRSPLYMKTYGNGMLSTISFRGTSASQTAVLWNGININSLSLGQMDFSILPLAGVSDVSIHFGAGSALYGSDAIGGVIKLSSEPAWTRGVKVNLQQEAGSFSHYNTMINASYGNGRVEGRTSLFYKNFKNNFPFINTARHGRPLEYQQNTTIVQKSLMQDVSYKISDRSSFTLNTWLADTYREIQPTMTVRSSDHQTDRNLKLSGNYFLNLGRFSTIARAAYISDVIDFNESVSLVKRGYMALQQDFLVNQNFEIKAGADWNHIVADISGYGAVQTEDRNDVFILTRYRPTGSWLLSLNLRQAFVSGFNAPLAPSLGSELIIGNFGIHTIKWKAHLSRNYRIPTLNDRYWLRGGNKNLLPEESFNTETGFVYEAQKGNFLSSTEASAFYNYVENWIAWIPKENFWQAENIKEVKARGIELLHKIQYKELDWSLGLNLHYSFTRSTNERSENPLEIGKQLIYTPLHNGNVNLELNYKNWFLNPGFNYTGLRYTTSENLRKLQPYWLTDVFAGRSFVLSGYSVSAFIRFNNLTNEAYQNYEYRAMPGRNFMVSLRVGI